MALLTCCNVNQKVKIYKVVPTRKNVEDEFVLHLERCAKCQGELVEVVRVDIFGQMLKSVRLKNENVKEFLDSMIVIWKPKKLSCQQSGHYSWVLEYNEWGKKRKCSSNLYALKMGRFETDPFEDLRHYQQFRKGSWVKAV